MSEAKQDELTPGKFCWNELLTPDVEAAKKFYGELFGWTFESMPMPDGEYIFGKSGDEPRSGMMQIQKEWGEVPPHWMSYVAVENVEASVEKAKSLGGTILQDTKAVGEMGTLAIVQDPTGAVLAFWKKGSCE